MAGHTVEYLVGLIDKFSAPSANLRRSADTLNKAMATMGASANKAESSIGRLGANMSSAAGGASGLARNANAARSAIANVGSAAQASAASINKLNASMMRTRGGAVGGGAAKSVFLGGGGGGGVTGGLAAWIGVPAIFTATLEAAKAENKFRALVPNVTPEQMSGIRGDLEARILKSGEKYAVLMDAAGDAAQIVQSAGKAGKIAAAASKLANIDTDGKDVKFFAESLAAVMGPNGSLEDLARISGILAKSQMLGAATAGGMIEAYKNVAAYKKIYGFDDAAMLTSFSLIKDVAPALQDSQIGNMAKYGVRTLAAPLPSFRKKLRGLGLRSSSFETDGEFDIAKTQKLFHEMLQTEKGKAAFKDLFAGKNVLAGQYWSLLAGLKPEKFMKRYFGLSDNKGALDAADAVRLEGIVGQWNAFRSSIAILGRNIGDFLTPAFTQLNGVIAPTVQRISSLMGWLQKSAPTISSWAGTWLGVAGALGLVGTLWGPAGRLAKMMITGPFALLRGVGAGLLGGLLGGLAGAGRQIALVGRFAGALAALRVAAMGLARLSGIGTLLWISAEAVAHWSQIAAFAKSIGADMKNWAQGNAAWDEKMKGYAEKQAQHDAAMKNDPGVGARLQQYGDRGLDELFKDVFIRGRVPQPNEVKVTAPPAIDIRVHVDGDAQGTASGSLPLSATAPRGTTMANPPAPAVPR